MDIHDESLIYYKNIALEKCLNYEKHACINAKAFFYIRVRVYCIFHILFRHTVYSYINNIYILYARFTIRYWGSLLMNMFLYKFVFW